jgi:hypothetical protein
MTANPYLKCSDIFVLISAYDILAFEVFPVLKLFLSDTDSWEFT